MKIKKSNMLFFLLFLVSIGQAEIFIRINQAGFLKDDKKSAIVLSNSDLSTKKMTIVHADNGKNILQINLTNNRGKFAEFNYTYHVEFDELNNRGFYYLQISDKRSQVFEIGDQIYNSIADSLLAFFKVQRCGFNQALLHDPCHLYDATGVSENGRMLSLNLDLTGGWHDAGDYIKFLNTTAYTVYTLLFAYEFDPLKFGFDSNNNQFPDILEEAKVGLDWLLKCNYREYALITQVQDLRDHDVGWRMPEDDPLTFERPAFVGSGKNIIGIYSASLVASFRIFKEFPDYKVFADKCLTVAENIYSTRNQVPDLDLSPSGAYQDTKYLGKLALAAIELHLATQQDQYLSQAKKYAREAGSDFWWSWGDINSFAHFHLAKIDESFKNYIYKNLEFFSEQSESHLFGEAAFDNWGANNAVLGVALQAILWKRLTNDSSFDGLATTQRDFILGRNQWGVSFIYNVGSDYSANFHSQVAFYNQGKLPGAVAAGAISLAKLDKYPIPYETSDRFSRFQTPKSVYRDDRNDYITNEPTIVANATALFVFGNLIN